MNKSQETQREVQGVDREIVSALIDSGAINFEAIGQTVAKFGAASAFLDDYEIRWCGSDIRTWKWPRGPRLEELGALVEVIRQIPGR
jgi:hypothetical protein